MKILTTPANKIVEQGERSVLSIFVLRLSQRTHCLREGRGGDSMKKGKEEKQIADMRP